MSQIPDIFIMYVFHTVCVPTARQQRNGKKRPVAGRGGGAVSSAAAAVDSLKTKGGSAASERIRI